MNHTVEEEKLLEQVAEPTQVEFTSPVSREEPSSTSTKRWYVVYASPGKELSVARNIRDRIKMEKLEHKFDEVVVPTEEVVELRGGKKRKSERKIFPGYILVRMLMDEQTWHFIKAINKRGFVGGTNEKPAPLSDKEVNEILQRVQEGAGKPKPKVTFVSGGVVHIIDGPFAGFDGVVESVNYEKSKLKVSVLIFGRSTPVDLDFNQVQKA